MKDSGLVTSHMSTFFSGLTVVGQISKPLISSCDRLISHAQATYLSACRKKKVDLRPTTLNRYLQISELIIVFPDESSTLLPNFMASAYYEFYRGSS